MNALEVYAILNKKLKSVISGVSSVSIEGTSITWTFTNGTTSTMTFPEPTSIKDVLISDTRHLICTLSNGDVIDAGELPKMEVKISKESGNALVEKEDGLYVSKSAITVDESSLSFNEKGELEVNPDYVSEILTENNTISDKELEELFNG